MLIGMVNFICSNQELQDDDNEYELAHIYTKCKDSMRFKKIRKEKYLSKLTLYLVFDLEMLRNLDDSAWINFFDFYVDICKKIIRDNKKDCQSA